MLGSTSTTLAQAFLPVKSPLQGAALSSNHSPERPTALTSPLQINTQLPLFPGSVRHHRNYSSLYIIGNIAQIRKETNYYGVSSSHRVLTPGLFSKRYGLVRDCLQQLLKLPAAQREVTLRLLTLWTYYGQVYPNEATVTMEPGCSKATYWRTVRRLRDLHLVQVVNRFLSPHRRQISNLYLLDKLVLIIARYLAEHGTAFYQKWLRPVLSQPGSVFWPSFWGSLIPLSSSPPENTI